MEKETKFTKDDLNKASTEEKAIMKETMDKAKAKFKAEADKPMKKLQNERSQLMEQKRGKERENNPRKRSVLGTNSSNIKKFDKSGHPIFKEGATISDNKKKEIIEKLKKEEKGTLGFFERRNAEKREKKFKEANSNTNKVLSTMSPENKRIEHTNLFGPRKDNAPPLTPKQIDNNIREKHKETRMTSSGRSDIKALAGVAEKLESPVGKAYIDKLKKTAKNKANNAISDIKEKFKDNPIEMEQEIQKARKAEQNSVTQDTNTFKNNLRNLGQKKSTKWRKSANNKKRNKERKTAKRNIEKAVFQGVKINSKRKNMLNNKALTRMEQLNNLGTFRGEEMNTKLRSRRGRKKFEKEAARAKESIRTAKIKANIDIRQQGIISKKDKENIRKNALIEMGNQKGSFLWGTGKTTQKQKDILKTQTHYQDNLVNRAHKEAQAKAQAEAMAKAQQELRLKTEAETRAKAQNQRQDQSQSQGETVANTVTNTNTGANTEANAENNAETKTNTRTNTGTLQQQHQQQFKQGDTITALKQVGEINIHDEFTIGSVIDNEYTITTGDKVITITKTDLDNNFTKIN